MVVNDMFKSIASVSRVVWQVSEYLLPFASNSQATLLLYFKR